VPHPCFFSCTGCTVGHTVSKQTNDLQRCFEPDQPALVGVAQYGKTPQGARYPDPILGAAAPDTESFLGVVAGTRKAQACPGAPLPHLHQQPAESYRQPFFETDEMTYLSIECRRISVSGATLERLE